MKPIDTHRDQLNYPEISGAGVPYPPQPGPVGSVAIVSGGMDSVTMLYVLASAGYTPIVLSFDYGQKHKKELGFAEWHAGQLGLRHMAINLGGITDLLGSSALVGTSEVPEGHYADETMKATVVPNRNMIMISIAAAAVIHFKARVLGLGVHAGDHPVYPDCRPDFVYQMERVLHIANQGFIDPGFQMFTPFLYVGKQDIVMLGDQLGVPWANTWSCYKGGELHCGKCGTCVERKEAFDLAMVIDPTEYEDA
jgi:7-cyano-7-deazaguanine synthase